MSSTNENLITAEEVMRRIRGRLGMGVGMEQVPLSIARVAAPDSATSAMFLPRVLPLRPPLDMKQAYSLGEFLIYDDIDFVNNAYQALFHRAPDEASVDFVYALRQGRLAKVEVLGQLRFSQEGMRHGVHVDGLLLPYKLRTWRKKRFVGPMLGWLISLGRIGALFDRHADHMAMASAEIQSNRDTVNAMAEGLEDRLSSIERAVSLLPSSASVQQLRSELDQHFERISLLEAGAEKHREQIDGILSEGHQQRSKLDQYFERISLLEASVEKHQEQLDGIPVETHYDGHDLDQLYAAFEDQFRGSRELIRQRIAPYLDFVESVGAGKPATPIVDLGCGRGEWLQLLRERGYIARGIELNRVFIDTCRGRGLEVIEGDAITTLRTLQDNSVGVISLMHLAEHLPFTALIVLLDEALRVLIPGGGLIMETPNPENALVSRWAFYMDPTHRNPLPPEMLRWMVEARGFMFAEIRRLFEGRPVDAAAYLQDDIPGAHAVNELLAPSHASLDYAILARKPDAAS